MKPAYQNMRNFWLDIANLENRKGILEIGADKVAIAGLEFAVWDGAGNKHIFIATNSLGDSSFYFENNSPSGIGGMIGGHGNENLQTSAARMLAYAAKLTGQMKSLPAGSDLPHVSDAQTVCLFAVSKEKLFFIQVAEQDVKNPEHPFYPMFAYAQQTIGHFRQQQLAGADNNRS
jgi:hypothetical protein